MAGATVITLLIYASITLAKCPSGAIVGPHGSCYIIRFTPKDWQDASDECTKHGGFLASIHNDETNNFVGQWLSNFSPNADGLWIGAVSPTPEVLRSWRWTDASTFDYTNWAAGKEGVLTLSGHMPIHRCQICHNAF